MFLKNVKVQFLAVLGLGALLGYAAAYGHLNPFAKADAGATDQPKAAASSAPAAPGCCSDGLSKAGMLALADHNEIVKAKAAASGKKPNILVIMGDDIGMWNIGVYHRGLMAGRTPNLDKMAKEGMIFTDYYAEASCTAGPANFITGELPIRTGMTTVGQAGAKLGLPAEACTIATALKALGYATGQFGKNHLGDRNEFLPTVHGFDEFFGYLYHLDAMEDPASQLSTELVKRRWPAQHGPLLGHGKGGPDRDAALGQGRQAEDRGRRHALPQADGDGRRRNPRPRLEVHRQGQSGQQALLRLAQPNAHAHRHPPFPQMAEDCATRRMAGRSRRPAWPNSTTTSVSL